MTSEIASTDPKHELLMQGRELICREKESRKQLTMNLTAQFVCPRDTRKNELL